ADLGNFEMGKPPGTPGSRRRRSRSNSAFAAAAMVPSIVAGSIGGWSPIERQREGESLNTRKDIEAQDGISVHPQTDPSVNVLADPPRDGHPPSQNEELRPASAVETARRTEEREGDRK